MSADPDGLDGPEVDAVVAAHREPPGPLDGVRTRETRADADFEVARDRGFRYAQGEALPTSRPILQRHGFAVARVVTPFCFVPPTGPGEP